jgi:hypothetical protein
MELGKPLRQADLEFVSLRSVSLVQCKRVAAVVDRLTVLMNPEQSQPTVAAIGSHLKVNEHLVQIATSGNA